MSLDIGDVFFKIKADLAATRDSLNDTDKQVDWYKNKWSQPVAISFTGGPGGGGGFGGGGGGGSWGSSLGGGGMGPQATANKQLGISSWSTSSPNFSPQGSSNVAWTGYGVSAGGMGWTSSAGPWGKTIGMGGAFDDDVFNRGVNYYQNQSRQRSVASGIQGMEQDAFVSGGLEYYSTNSRRKGVQEHIDNLEKEAIAEQRHQEKVTSYIEDHTNRRREIVSRGLQNMEQDTASVAADDQRFQEYIGGSQDRVDRVSGLFNRPSMEEATGTGRRDFVSRVGMYMAVRTGIYATAATVSGAAEYMQGQSALGFSQSNPEDAYAQTIANRNAIRSTISGVPLIGPMFVGGRQLRDVLSGEDEATLNMEKSIGAGLESSTKSILANKRGEQATGIELANTGNNARMAYNLGVLEDSDKLAQVNLPYEERMDQLKKEEGLSKVQAMWQDLTSRFLGRGGRDMPKAYKDMDEDLKKSLEDIKKEMGDAHTKASTLQQFKEGYNLKVAESGEEQISRATDIMGLGLDPESEFSRRSRSVANQYDAQISITDEVTLKTKLIQEKTAAVDLQERQNDLDRQKIRVDTELIKYSKGSAELSARGSVISAKLYDLQETETAAWETNAGNRTPENYERYSDAIARNRIFKEVELPRTINDMLNPLKNQASVQGIQMQAAHAIMNQNFSGANVLNWEAGIASSVLPQYTEIQKMRRQPELAGVAEQMQQNLINELDLDAMTIKSRHARGYGEVTSITDISEAQAQGKPLEENFSAMLKVLDEIKSWLMSGGTGRNPFPGLN